MKRFFILINICLVLFACASSMLSPEQTGYFYGKPTLESLKELEAKIKQAKEGGRIVEELNLNMAAAQITFYLKRYKQVIEFSNRALQLIESIEYDPDLKKRWIKSYTQKLSSLLSDQEKKETAVSYLISNKLSLYTYLAGAYNSRGQTDMAMKYRSKWQNLFQKVQQTSKKKYQTFWNIPLKQAKKWSWMPGGKKQVSMLKRQQEIHMKLGYTLKFILEKLNEFEKNWFKMSKKERREFVENTMLEAKRRYKEYCELEAENVIRFKGELVKIEGRVMNKEQLASWCMEKHLTELKIHKTFFYLIGHMDEEMVRLGNELMDKGELNANDSISQLLIRQYAYSAWRLGDKSAISRILSWADQNRFLLPSYSLALIMDYADLFSEKEFIYLPDAMEKYLEKEEAKRFIITSERDRIAFIKQYIPIISVLVAYHFQRENYEKAISLALKSKSRTLVDLMLTGATFDVSRSKNKEEIVAAYMAGKRGITVKSRFLKEASLFDLEMKIAGRVPGIEEIAKGLPEDTALIEMFTTEKELYIWIIGKEGIVETKRWSISSWELGEKVWSFRANLEKRDIKREEGSLKVSIRLSETPEGISYLDIYLENQSYRPISPFRIDLTGYKKRKNKKIIKIDPTVSLVEAGKKVIIGHYPFKYLEEGVFSIDVTTEYGILKEEFAIEKGKLIEIKEGDRDINLERKFQDKSLGNLIFEPFLERLSHYKHLIISPHGVLHYLPFLALKINGKYAIERWTINVVPTSSILPLISDLPSLKKGTVLIFGDPLYPSSDFPPLPGARDEASTIAKILKNNVLLFLGDKAKEGLFKSRASNASVIHIASHGVFLPASPMDSFLLFTPDSQNDGRLTAKELFSLKLSSHPIVVLSACETGLSQMADGDELLGLTRGFLYAGASAVINSLWKIDDEATKFLMSHFYLYISQGKTPSEAMRLSILKALSSEEFKSPIYWGAFVVVGKI